MPWLYIRNFSPAALHSPERPVSEMERKPVALLYMYRNWRPWGPLPPLHDSETICTVVGTVLHGGTCHASIAVFFQAASRSNKQRRCSIWPHRFFMPFAKYLAPSLLYTAKTQYRKFETNILRKGIARPKSQFPHTCVCETEASQFLFWEYINGIFVAVYVLNTTTQPFPARSPRAPTSLPNTRDTLPHSCTTPTHAPTAHNTSCVSGVCRKLFISWVSLTESLRLIMAPILPVYLWTETIKSQSSALLLPCLHRIISAFFQPFQPQRLSACARSCLFQPTD